MELPNSINKSYVIARLRIFAQGDDARSILLKAVEASREILPQGAQLVWRKATVTQTGVLLKFPPGAVHYKDLPALCEKIQQKLQLLTIPNLKAQVYFDHAILLVLKTGVDVHGESEYSREVLQKIKPEVQDVDFRLIEKKRVKNGYRVVVDLLTVGFLASTLKKELGREVDFTSVADINLLNMEIKQAGLRWLNLLRSSGFNNVSVEVRKSSVHPGEFDVILIIPLSPTAPLLKEALTYSLLSPDQRLQVRSDGERAFFESHVKPTPQTDSEPQFLDSNFILDLIEKSKQTPNLSEKKKLLDQAKQLSVRLKDEFES